MNPGAGAERGYHPAVSVIAANRIKTEQRQQWSAWWPHLSAADASHLLLHATTNGVNWLPIVRPCEGWTPEHGCPGHGGAKEHGVLFTDEMVLAILRREKTVTRRTGVRWKGVLPGDRLWVRECWKAEGSEIRYRSSNDRCYSSVAEQRPWRPSIFMRRSDSRLLLSVESVDWMDHSLLDVDDAEARREGFRTREDFLAVWKRLHGDEKRPVCRVKFKAS